MKEKIKLIKNPAAIKIKIVAVNLVIPFCSINFMKGSKIIERRIDRMRMMKISERR